MGEMIGGSLVFVMGVFFLWIGLFQYKWLYKGIQKVEEEKIDILPISFINSYWFWRIVFIGLGVLLLFITGDSFISMSFFN